MYTLNMFINNLYSPPHGIIPDTPLPQPQRIIMKCVQKQYYMY